MNLTHPFRIAKRALAWRGMALGLAALHVIIALYEYCHGLNFCSDPERGRWDYFWQAIPTTDLLQHPWKSFWALHAQPPGFSLWGWFWLLLCGPANFPASIQIGYVILGAATVALTYQLALALTRHPGWAIAAGLGMALNPALFYYESYLLYESLVVFLLTASAWCLWKALAGKSLRWLLAFAIALNLLVLTRSLYHGVFLIGALFFAWPLWRAIRPRHRWLLLIFSLALPSLWYAKNAAQYGFFGASSWQGLGLYKCVSTGLSYRELVDLRDRKIIPYYMEHMPPFSELPAKYRPYGFCRTSNIPLLWRNDFNNINIPEISRQFGQTARKLIHLYPWRYLRAIHGSYINFSRPPSRFYQLGYQRMNHIGWEPFVTQWLYGQWFTDEISWSYLHYQFGSMFYFYFPLLMASGAIWAWRRWKDCLRQKLPPADWARPALAAYFIYACLYVAAIGCLMENGENERFRFATEPMTLILALILARGVWRRWIVPAARRFRLS